tara:strand:- start:175 stop:3153 length:2979 start_codon:yes stop_codon:yes gene_type:complete
VKFQFDPNQNHQRIAWESAIGIFEGQELNKTIFSMPSVQSTGQLNLMSGIKDIEKGFGNRLVLLNEDILENLKHIQLSNGLKQSKELKSYDFTIEMETGTGKTYVYLRSIFEMNKKYGFTKFIIVVPSIAIKEGVYKSLQTMENHFQELYENVPFDYFVYNSRRLEQVRSFASNNYLQIMIINIDAFRKSFSDQSKENSANIIHRWNDKMQGVPIDFIKYTRPILIIDEPQSVDTTAKSREAISSLNPLCTFRYSATHIDKFNMIYKLDAVDAYEQKLVKQIEVASLEVEDGYNKAFIKLLEVDNKKFHRARIEVDIQQKSGIKRKALWVKQGTDLFEDITKRNIYEGFIINDIHCEKGNEYIDFLGRDEILRLNNVIGDFNTDEFKRSQIRKTIEEHLNKELRLNPMGIKVLSLIFIDKVSNYRNYNNQDGKGKYAKIFEEEYSKAIKKPKYNKLFLNFRNNKIPEDAHEGYFSKDRKGSFTDTKGTTIADEDTFNLIMKDKEKLLDFNSKLRFIFSHSALKEGWDNPNVFQICTLNDTKSIIKKRQEIGRGLRLAVNQEGKRVKGFDINTLTVMANESYEDFVEGLQKEIEEEEGIKFGVIQDNSFSNIVIEKQNGQKSYLGLEASEKIWNALKKDKYIEENGKVNDSLKTDLKNETLIISEEYEKYRNEIIAILKKVAGGINIKNNSDKRVVKLNKKVFNSPEFIDLWNRIKIKTSYSVNFNPIELINNCAEKINKDLIVTKTKLKYKVAKTELSQAGFDVTVTKESTQIYDGEDSLFIPDILTYLQNETNLKRKSVLDILIKSGRLKDFKNNPQKFIDEVKKIINREIRSFIVNGIKYQKIKGNHFFHQELFESEELIGFLKKNMVEVKKSVYDHVIYDAETEFNLISFFENNNEIKLYTKLPKWFKIETPLGTYNPDWAVLFQMDEMEKLYLVAESKGSILNENLRGIENDKIECAKKHFKALGNGSQYILASDDTTFLDQAINKYS